MRQHAGRFVERKNRMLTHGGSVADRCTTRDTFFNTAASARYHITRNTMIPCQRPVPTSENDPRVLLNVPNDDGSLAL
jgi:hypothetical protein